MIVNSLVQLLAKLNCGMFFILNWHVSKLDKSWSEIGCL
jgi:hypothetical protein